jgi:ATP-dependent DNA helicase RecQ
VADERGLKLSTVTGHLAQAVKLGEITVNEVTGLKDEELAEIRKTFEDLTGDGTGTLGRVFEALSRRYDYELLKCVRMDMQRD